MLINDYLEYIDYFNSRQYDRYYTDDVVVELPSARLEGKPAVKEFYGRMNQHVHETVRVSHAFSDEGTLLAHVWSDFYCHRDWPDFIVRPVVKGDLLRVELLVLYTIREGRFCRIRAARLKGPLAAQASQER